MLVRSLDEVLGTDKEVDGGNWVSRRLLLKDDGMGYSVHDTIIKEGTETHIHYKNHLEAVYLTEGAGEVETVSDGKIWPIKAGDIYALDKNDEHYLRANKGTHMRMVCVFLPAISGKEVHDADGVYPADTD